MDSITGNVVGTEDVRTTMATDGDAMENVFVGTAQDNRLWTEDELFANSYHSGAGSINNPFKIATAAELARLSQQVCDKGKDKDKYFELIADIDLSAHLWKPIGHDDQIFKGHFHGEHHTIHGMRIDMQGLKNKWLDIGFFGRTDDADIDSVNLTGISICGNQYNNQSIQVGGLVGQAVNTKITNCAVQGDEIFIRFSYNGSGDSLSGIYAGGLVGRFNENIQSWGSNIYQCASYVDKIIVDTAKNITDIHVGGIVGQGGWAGNYGVAKSFAVSDVGKSTNAEIVGLGALVGFSNLNSNVSKNLYFLDVANFRPVGSYFHSAHEIETIMVDECRMKNEMKELLVTIGWAMSEEINNGFAFPGNQYTVTFANHYNNSYSDHKAAYGYKLTMPPTPNVDDATFLGWYDSNGVLYTEGDIYMLSEDIMLTAEYNMMGKYVVAFDKQGGSGGTDKIIATDGKEMPDINVPMRTGYDFSGYYTDTDGQGARYYDVNGNHVRNCDFTKDCSLFAYWKPVSYKVLLKNEGGSGEVISVKAKYGSSLEKIKPPTRLAYQFCGYFLYPHGEGSQYYDINGKGIYAWDKCCDTALYAMWKENNEITITINPYVESSVFRDERFYPIKVVAKVNCAIPGVEFNARWTKEASSDSEDNTPLVLLNTEDGYAVQVFSVEQSGVYTFSIMPVLDGVALNPVYSEPIQLTLFRAQVSFITSDILQYYDGTPKCATVMQTPGEKPVFYLYSVFYQNDSTGEITSSPIDVGEYGIFVRLENVNLRFKGCTDRLREWRIETLRILPGSPMIENLHWSGAEKNAERTIALWDRVEGANLFIVKLLKRGSFIVMTEDMLPEGAILLDGGVVAETNSFDLSTAITEETFFHFAVVRYSEPQEKPAISDALKALAEVEKAGWKDSDTLVWSAVEGADHYVIQLFEGTDFVIIDKSVMPGTTGVINAEQGLFRANKITEVNLDDILANVFGECTYTVLPGSDDPTRYTPVTYSPVRSEVRP